MTSASVCISNQYSIFENVCDLCNCVRSVCPHTSSEDNCLSSEIKNCHNDNIGKECLNLHKMICKQRQNYKIKVRTENSESITHRTIESVPRAEASLIRKNYLQLNLSDKGLNFGHLNIQGICGRDLSKFSEIKAILNINKNLHILGLSETKLKDHKITSMFHVEGYQTPFRKDNDSNGRGGIMIS